MVQLLIFVVVAVGVSFVCSLLESAFLSMSPGFVAAATESNASYAPKLQQLKKNSNDALAAILILNTIANTIGATGAGAQALKVFGEPWVAAFTAVLTLAILVISEIIPKSFGNAYWRALAPVVVRTLWILVKLLSPFVKLSGILTRALTRNVPAEGMSREEIQALGEIGLAAGAIDADEFHVLKNLWRFDPLKVSSVMTPRPVIYALSEKMSIEQAVESLAENKFSRIPLYGLSLDELEGFVLRSDILLEAARGDSSRPISDFGRELLIVPENAPLRNVVEQLVDRHEHIAGVVDEYGVPAGVVTLEDILETLLGTEILDEKDEIEDMQAWARERWCRRAASKGISLEPPDQE